MFDKWLRGNDGLTWWERRRHAKEYWEAQQRGDEWRAQRARRRAIQEEFRRALDSGSSDPNNPQ